jgi:hypothetical protein
VPRVRVPVPERAPERQAAARAPEALRQAGVRRGGGGGLRGARGQRAASRYRGFRASVVVYWTGVWLCMSKLGSCPDACSRGWRGVPGEVGAGAAECGGGSPGSAHEHGDAAEGGDSAGACSL